MKRPILIAIIGYIIGIIVGIYLNASIFLFYIPIIAIYLIYKIKKNTNHKSIKNKLKLFSLKRYLRYIKIYINSKVIFLIMLSSIISNSVVLFQNKKYQKIYNELSNIQKVTFVGTVTSNKEEKQYYDRYKLKTKYKDKNITIYVSTNKKQNLCYGDEIIFWGEYIKPEIQRNYRGFDYANYLKQQKIYGSIKISNYKVIKKKNRNILFLISNRISDKIIKNTKTILDNKDSAIVLGLILGYKNDIEEDIQENFRNASMAHILAISGMHISYIVLGINIIFKKLIGKRYTYFLSIIVLIFYMFVTNFSPSIVRAGIMVILFLISKIIYRKNDIYTSMAISLFIILIYNPFLIQNIGLQLSYGGVLGIIILNKYILNFLRDIKIKNKYYKYFVRPKIQKILDKIKEIISISISVQLFILPILIKNMNTFNPYFWLSGLILSIVIGPIVIINFLFVICGLIYTDIAKYVELLIKTGTKILIYISNIGKLPFAKIYIPTPNLFSILTYYIFIYVIFAIYSIYSAKNPSSTQIRLKNIIAIIKMKCRKNKNRIYKIILSIFICTIILKLIPKNLKVYFIDVGQGDSTFIVTPNNKTILVDGGGNKDYNVGKNTLLPYILDRGYNSIDYVFISHFDNDHVGGLLYLIDEIKIKNIVIGKQFEISDNYKKFVESINRKNINIIVVEAGKRLIMENNLYFDILWPYTNKKITENLINNNSLVCKLYYKKFEILFTGDIEEPAENELLEKYKESNTLKATVLKVAHHGSKTSSTEQFLKCVKPKYALIGVGKNNKFGHPSESTIENLQKLGTKVYRTDFAGEITIKTNGNSKMYIFSKFVNNK